VYHGCYDPRGEDLFLGPSFIEGRKSGNSTFTPLECAELAAARSRNHIRTLGPIQYVSLEVRRAESSFLGTSFSG
jgi:hypothetical protein